LTEYLLDTNVLSAFAPTKSRLFEIDPRLVNWLRLNTDRLFFSAVTAVEIEAGIIRLGRTAPGSWHQRLAAWYASILGEYEERILALDLTAARMASAFTDQARAGGSNPGFADLCIAATAATHGMTLLTRNLRHFAMLGIDAVDPFTSLPTK
jgi:predicted nucleic acid-binding protein